MKLFDINSVEDVIKQLNLTLRFPYAFAYSSALGGEEHVGILLSISTTPKQLWVNGIKENSKYANIHIHNDGKVEQFSGHQLRLRKFTAKSVGQIVDKINNIKEL